MPNYIRVGANGHRLESDFPVLELENMKTSAMSVVSVASHSGAMDSHGTWSSESQVDVSDSRSWSGGMRIFSNALPRSNDHICGSLGLDVVVQDAGRSMPPVVAANYGRLGEVLCRWLANAGGMVYIIIMMNKVRSMQRFVVLIMSVFVVWISCCVFFPI